MELTNWNGWKYGEFKLCSGKYPGKLFPVLNKKKTKINRTTLMIIKFLTAGVIGGSIVMISKY